MKFQSFYETNGIPKPSATVQELQIDFLFESIVIGINNIHKPSDWPMYSNRPVDRTYTNFQNGLQFTHSNIKMSLFEKLCVNQIAINHQIDLIRFCGNSNKLPCDIM